MKIGMFFLLINSAIEAGEIKGLDEGLSIVSSRGVSMVDLASSHLNTIYNPKELLAALKNYGIGVSSVFHTADLDYENKNILKLMREDTKKRIEDCAKMESPLFMPVPLIKKTHSGDIERRDCQEVVASYLNDVCEIAAPYHITAVLENFSDLNSTYATVEDIDFLLKQIPELYYVLDTGNFWFCDSNVQEACELFSGRIRHVHLKDITPSSDGFLKVNGKNCDSNEIGSGIIDFDGIFEKLHSICYDGAVSVEINNPGDLMRKTELSFSYLKSRSFSEYLEY